MSDKAAVFLPVQEPWQVQFPTGFGTFSAFTISGPQEMRWLAQWMLEAYNRDQPKREDYE